MELKHYSLGDRELAQELAMAPIYEPKAKRRKLDVAGTGSKSIINSAQDLHDLLQFKQTSSPEVKDGKIRRCRKLCPG
jgi:hypothetical protein